MQAERGLGLPTQPPGQLVTIECEKRRSESSPTFHSDCAVDIVVSRDDKELFRPELELLEQLGDESRSGLVFGRLAPIGDVSGEADEVDPAIRLNGI
jgi:hypothetical protein